MTAISGGPELHRDAEDDLGGLADLAGLETVTQQLAGRIAVIRADQGCRRVGTPVTRAAWKNFVFTGGPGVGKSRAAEAVARIYKDLGALSSGHLDEVAAVDLAGTTPRATGALVGEAFRRAGGGIVLITEAHAWSGLPDRGQQVLRRLYVELTDWRDHRRDELAVILAGQKGPLRGLLAASPALAARFPAVIDFPGYTPAQLAAIFATLAGEAGFTLTPAAAGKAAAVLAEADDHRGGSARLAVRLLDQVTASQARRITTASPAPQPAALGTIHAADIPGHLHTRERPDDDERPGLYL